MYRSSRESSSSDEDELVIWPYGESVWDEHPESAMRAASYFRASRPRDGTMPRDVKDKWRYMKSSVKARDAHMRQLEQTADAREELEDRKQLHRKISRPEERKEALVRRNAHDSRSVAAYLRMPPEKRDLTYALEGTKKAIEEDAARAYHMQVLDAVKRGKPLSYERFMSRQ